MLYAGVSWSADGYAVAMVDEEGGLVRPLARYRATHTEEMINHLRATAAERPLATVVDSTCGILDGRMMAAGLRVYRADPWVLPERPAFGSVPAEALASAARIDLSALALLERDRGTQTGRETDLRGSIAASQEATDRMIRAGRCLGHGDRDGREVALTFDDGPNPPYTDRILDVLERYGVPATFFCVGMNAAAYPEQIARMREQGHAVGNHTWSHPFLTELSHTQLTEQIDRTAAVVAEAAGGAVPSLFRPPYGSRNPQVVDWLTESDQTVVLWDVDTDDWSMPGADTISRAALDATKAGSIILMHDGGGDRSQTADALPAIIEGGLERGLRWATVDALTGAGLGSGARDAAAR